MIRLVCAALAALPLVASAQAGAGTQDTAPTPPQAPRVYAGIGLGGSTLGGAGESGPGQAFRIRLGLARSERLLLGLEASLDDADARQVSAYDVAATFFPWRRFLYLRGGFGLSTLTRLSGPSEQGVNALLGVGVALGRPKGLTVSVNLDTRAHLLRPRDGTDHEVSSASAWLGLDWY